jgi:hypothetical protein
MSSLVALAKVKLLNWFVTLAAVSDFYARGLLSNYGYNVKAAVLGRGRFPSLSRIAISAFLAQILLVL